MPGENPNSSQHVDAHAGTSTNNIHAPITTTPAIQGANTNSNQNAVYPTNSSTDGSMNYSQAAPLLGHVTTGVPPPTAGAGAAVPPQPPTGYAPQAQQQYSSGTNDYGQSGGNASGPPLPTGVTPGSGVVADPSSQTTGMGYGTYGAAVGGASAPKGQPKRLHVSNIPFRFREPDLRHLFYVSYCVCVCVCVSACVCVLVLLK